MAKVRINTALWAATVLLAGGAVAVVAWAVLAPVAGPGAVDARAGRAGGSATRPSGVPPIESFEPVWEARLRRPLVDGGVEVAEVGPAASNGTLPPLTLVGTIGTSLAMLRTPSAQVEVRGVGETLMGVEVVAVRPAQVDVRYNGKLVTLSKPAEQPAGR